MQRAEFRTTGAWIPYSQGLREQTHRKGYLNAGRSMECAFIWREMTFCSPHPQVVHDISHVIVKNWSKICEIRVRVLR
jgi:hypothetical protein